MRILDYGLSSLIFLLMGHLLNLLFILIVFRSAHLLGMAGKEFLPHDLSFDDSLDAFSAFYVNKYSDHQANEIAF